MSISPLMKMRESQEFAEKIETIFRRNGIAYRLVEDGSRASRGFPVFQESVI